MDNGINRLMAVTQLTADQQLDAASSSQQLMGQTAQDTIHFAHGMGIGEVTNTLEAFSWASNVVQTGGITPALTNKERGNQHHPSQFLDLAINFNAKVSSFVSAEELSNAYHDPKLDVGGGLQGIRNQIQQSLEGGQGSDDQQDQFKIQQLMSEYNEAQDLAGNVQQKMGQTLDNLRKLGL